MPRLATTTPWACWFTSVLVEKRSTVRTGNKFAGVWLPKHIEQSEDGRLTVALDQSFTQVDSFPADTFVVPPGAASYSRCETFQGATGISMPQPPAGSGDNVDDIVLQGQIERDGRVTNPSILKSKRPDLNAEALQLITLWTFHPTTVQRRCHAVARYIYAPLQGKVTNPHSFCPTPQLPTPKLPTPSYTDSSSDPYAAQSLAESVGQSAPDNSPRSHPTASDTY